MVKTSFTNLVRDGVIISTLLPYSSLILSICCLLTFLARYYVFEPAANRYYGDKYTRLSPVQRSNFIHHHVTGAVKISMLLFGVYPTVMVLSGRASLHQPWGVASSVTMGDILLCITELYVSMYIFELIYRTSILPISVLHHVGVVLIAQAVLVLGLDPAHRYDAEPFFIICLVWSTFDVLAELWSNIGLILSRLIPDDHARLRQVFIWAAGLEFAGTLAEIILILIIYASFWDRWTISLAVTVPVIQFFFAIAQLRVGLFYVQRSVKQKKLALQEASRNPSPPAVKY